MKKVIIYPGRFQPMMQHHAQVFSRLQSQFAEAEVYLATSDKTDSDSSPFDFAQKQQIANLGFGLKPEKVLQVRRPYNADDYPFDLESTVMVFVVGEKDWERFDFDERDPDTGINMQKRDPSKPTLLQPIDTMGRDPLPASQRAYVMVTPDIQDLQDEAASASDFRQELTAAPDIETARRVFKKYYGEYNEQLFNLIYSKIVEPNMQQEQVNQMRKLAGLPEAQQVAADANDVQESAPVEFHGMSDQEKHLAELGRTLMHRAESERNEELANLMARVGNKFAVYGTVGEADSLGKLAAQLGLTQEKVLKFAEYAQAIYDTEGPVSIAGKSDPDYAEPSDELEEGAFTGIGKHMMKRKLKKGMDRDVDAAADAMDRAGEYDFADPDRFEDEDEFMHAMGQRGRKEKALRRLGGKVDEQDVEESEFVTKRVVGHEDREARMMQRELLKISDYANELIQMLDGLQDGDFPHWWQSKLTKAASYMSSIKHFLDGEQRLGPRHQNITPQVDLGPVADEVIGAIDDPQQPQ